MALSFQGTRAGHLDNCLWGHVPANATLRASSGDSAETAWSHNMGREDRFVHWRKPRRDVMLAAGAICYMTEFGSTRSFTATQAATLSSMFAQAVDPGVALTLDDLQQPLLQLL
jgi:hypothetical protein